MDWGSVSLGTLILWGLVKKLLAFQSALASPSATYLGIAQTIPGCVSGGLVKLQQWAVVVSVSLGVSWWHPCYEPPESSTALRSVSEAHLCTSHKTVPAAVTHHVLVVGLAVTEQMGLPGSAPAPLLMRWVFQSAEQRRGSAGARQASGEVSFSCRFMLLQASILLHFASLHSVWSWNCWMVGLGPCGSTAGWVWNQLSNSAPLRLHTLLTACCNSE